MSPSNTRRAFGPGINEHAMPRTGCITLKASKSGSRDGGPMHHSRPLFWQARPILRTSTRKLKRLRHGSMPVSNCRTKSEEKYGRPDSPERALLWNDIKTDWLSLQKDWPKLSPETSEQRHDALSAKLTQTRTPHPAKPITLESRWRPGTILPAGSGGCCKFPACPSNLVAMRAATAPVAAQMLSVTQVSGGENQCEFRKHSLLDGRCALEARFAARTGCAYQGQRFRRTDVASERRSAREPGCVRSVSTLGGFPTS